MFKGDFGIVDKFGSVYVIVFKFVFKIFLLVMMSLFLCFVIVLYYWGVFGKSEEDEDLVFE